MRSAFRAHYIHGRAGRKSDGLSANGRCWWFADGKQKPFQGLKAATEDAAVGELVQSSPW